MEIQIVVKCHRGYIRTFDFFHRSFFFSLPGSNHERERERERYERKRKNKKGKDEERKKRYKRKNLLSHQFLLWLEICIQNRSTLGFSSL